MKQKNMYRGSFGLILFILPVFLYGDIGSDATITQFNTQQVLALDNQRVATLAALSGGLAVNEGVTGTWDSFFPLSGPLALNGGTLSLNRDLLCRDVSSFQSLGSIFGNSHSVGIANSMGVIPIIATAAQANFSDIVLQLDGDVALNAASINFTGNCKINGGGNSLSFDSATTFVIASGATLYLDNMLVKNIGATNFVFQDASSCLKLSNVTLQLGDNITQHIGNVLIDGPMTLITRNYNWSVGDAALMTVKGVTLWTDPAGSFPAGALTFGNTDNLSLVSNGIIKVASSVLVDSSGNPIDFAGYGKRDPLDDALSTSTGFLQSQIDLLNFNFSSLQTSTGFLQSEIDELG
ncbi:MAG: hypothetical protein P4L31_04305, partial [Candidatus Babeliales bacterium]|nr:hypothetical protein [Candidatus Babeliales bacterium]